MVQCAGSTLPFTLSEPLSPSSSRPSPSLSVQQSLQIRSSTRILHEESLILQQTSSKPISKILQQRDLHASQNEIDTYLSLLRECCNSKDLCEGKLLHRRIVDDGYAQNRLLSNTLIQMYGRCGAFAQAHDVFTHLLEKNVFTWTIMLGACVDCGKIEEALAIFDQMPERNIVAWNIIILACAQQGLSSQAQKFYQELLLEATPNKITFLNLLPLCNHGQLLNQGIAIHGHIVKTGLECDTIITNALLNMYNKCGDLKMAEKMFEKIPAQDLFTWNTMISAYVQHGQGKEAIQLFPQMQAKGVIADGITYVGLVDACTAGLDACKGEDMHKCVVGDGFESDVIVGTSLINMYGKCKNLDAAKRSFNKMFRRDLIAWNAMMDAYAQQGGFLDAFQLITQMQLEGFVPDIVTFVSLLSSCTSPESLNTGRQIHKLIQLLGPGLDVALGNTLLNMYGKCGSLEEAQMVFDQMAQRNVVSWNAMITACIQCGQEKTALGLFQDMQQEGMAPDVVTLLGVIDACAAQAVLSEAKQTHGYIERFGLVSNAMIVSALIKMYNKCGSLEDAQRVFDETPVKDVILWNTMIASYAQHGLGEKALQMFEQMKMYGVKPNESTLAIVLSACSHAGLASKGKQYFLEITQEHGITPTMEHYNVLIDLLGRSGQISGVEDLIQSMPVQPDATSWLTLLSACKKHSDTEAGEVVAERVLECDPKSSGSYVLCANIRESQRCSRE
eukprot:c21129_g1_i1 orf=752-2941(-)